MDALKAKELPEKESTEPLEGLLYFTIDGKLKPKDVTLIYKAPRRPADDGVRESRSSY